MALREVHSDLRSGRETSREVNAVWLLQCDGFVCAHGHPAQINRCHYTSEDVAIVSVPSNLRRLA